MSRWWAQDVWIRWNNGDSSSVVGTSIAAPLWAGFAALANQLAQEHGQPPIGFINPVRRPGNLLWTDLDGNPRIVGGSVDIGAYEWQSPTSLISHAWLQQYGLPTDGSADYADPDGDGLNNSQEWRCGTDPANALSALRLLAPVNGGTNVTLTWESVAGASYSLERSTDLGVSPMFTPRATNILGQPGATTYADTNAIGVGRVFYRVGVQ